MGYSATGAGSLSPDFQPVTAQPSALSLSKKAVLRELLARHGLATALARRQVETQISAGILRTEMGREGIITHVKCVIILDVHVQIWN